MDAVKKGGNRQELHEKLRVHSQAAARVVKEEGGKNDLIDRICADPAFMITREEVEAILRPEQFTGRSCEQVEEVPARCDSSAAGGKCRFAGRKAGIERLNIEYFIRSPACGAETAIMPI